MSKILYDFWGNETDRSEIKYEFDGLTTRVLVEDQSNTGAYLEVSFSKVAQFDFESIAVLSDYPTEISEKLVESEVPPDFLKKVRSDAQTLFKDGLKQYSVFFQDIGTLKVIACSASVTGRRAERNDQVS